KTKPDASSKIVKSPDKRVFGLSGSPRKGGNSDVLLRHILKGIRQNEIPTEMVRLCNYQYQPCIGCEKCRKNNMCTGLNDGMHLLYPKIIESQGMVLVCPTHNYNITAWMKAFIDRFYCFYIFDNNRPRGWSSRLIDQNRKAVIAAVCEQVDKKNMGFTLEAMRLPIEALGYEVVGELAVFGIFDKGKVQDEDETLTKAIELGNQLAESL
ncbi:flavodoxin family protein, partial [Thermodesulfobacteriota bacterium]